MANRPKQQPRLIVLVDTDGARLGRRREALEGSTSGQEVEAISSFSAAEAFLTEARESGREIALVVVDASAEADPREQFLARVRAGFPAARLIVVGEAGKTCADHCLPEEDLLGAVTSAAEEGPRREEVVEVLGDEWLPRCHDIKDVLCRYRIPYRWIDSAGRRRSKRANHGDYAPSDFPLLLFADGTELRNPSDDELAAKLGFDTRAAERYYDLIIIGGGPAGLAAAVYASSEGLSTIVVEKEIAGGQAGTSALIENYLGFPEGLSGAELTERAVAQAERFGTEMLVTQRATSLRGEGPLRLVALEDGSEIASRCILIATGVAYSHLKCPGAEKLSGAGVYYGAAAAEASRFRDEEVCLAGGGNSAAQAAMLLARHARVVRMIFPESEIAEKMSSFLVSRLEATPNIEIIPGSTVIEARGGNRLESIVIENGTTKERREIPTRALFVSIGARPRTDWLSGTVAVDDEGFVLTGRELPAEAIERYQEQDRWPLHLETSLPGVFAAGDVRHGSVKRIGSAVGEGSMAVQFIHAYMREE